MRSDVEHEKRVEWKKGYFAFLCLRCHLAGRNSLIMSIRSEASRQKNTATNRGQLRIKS